MTDQRLHERDRALIAAIENGLPLVLRPYAEIGDRLGWDEDRVIERLKALIEDGTIKRFGVVVRHHELGYRANAMTVFDIDDQQVGAVGEKLSALSFVTLCYRRPRRPPHWPYNLFCMIHGKSENDVRALVEKAAAVARIADTPRAVLFSRRRFKQRGARYKSAVPNRSTVPT